MILSHQHRFIFVKTIKTAGTSLEIALASFCGQDDIITPITPEDERMRAGKGFRGAQHYGKPPAQWSRKEFGRYLFKWRRPEPIFFNHMTAAQIRARVPPEVWSSYYKFTIVRNPWDRAVSQYFWKNRKAPEDGRESFHDFLLRMPQIVQQNWPIYTENDRLLVDGVIRYEALEDGMEEVSRQIGLPPGLFAAFDGTRAKAQHRSTRFAMERRDADLIGALAEREVAEFGYRVPERLLEAPGQ